MPHARNSNAPWLLFEAGAISKQVTEKSRVCPYLLELKPTALLRNPLAQFQAVTTDEEGTRRLVKSVNKSLDIGGLSDERLDKAFALWWPQLRDALNKIESTGPIKETESVQESSLVIHEAKYGPSKESGIDVTDKVRRFVRNGVLRFKVDVSKFGDPFQGEAKSLFIEYSDCGERDSIQFANETMVSLPLSID